METGNELSAIAGKLCTPAKNFRRAGRLGTQVGARSCPGRGWKHASATYIENLRKLGPCSIQGSAGFASKTPELPWKAPDNLVGLGPGI